MSVTNYTKNQFLFGLFLTKCYFCCSLSDALCKKQSRISLWLLSTKQVSRKSTIHTGRRYIVFLWPSCRILIWQKVLFRKFLSRCGRGEKVLRNRTCRTVPDTGCKAQNAGISSEQKYQSKAS